MCAITFVKLRTLIKISVLNNTLTHAWSQVWHFGLLIFLLAAPSDTAGSSLLCFLSLQDTIHMLSCITH